MGILPFYKDGTINGIIIERNIGFSLLMAVVLLPVMVWTFRVK